MKVEVKNVEKYFKNNTVLEDISLEMESGKIYCLLGASGSGKTTLLRIIMGAIPANSGEVIVEGIKVPDKKILSMIGFMPQQDALYDELSVWDNLKFFAGIQNIKKELFESRALEILKIVGLEQDKSKLVGRCSGGMKKRVSLAATLLNNPPLLILDEPTVGIDPILRREIWDYFQILKNTGTAIIVTTHVMDEVSECDNAALLRNGRIIKADTVENLLKMTRNGKIEDLFLINAGEEA